jgi:hypothetical protein
VIRGTSSSASAVTRRSIKRAMTSSAPAPKRLITVAPGQSSDASSSEGRRTFATTCDSPKTSRTPPTRRAPAAAYASSGKKAAPPAPRWTPTSSPDFTRRATLSGTNATRRSPGVVSAGTPIRISGAGWGACSAWARTLPSARGGDKSAQGTRRAPREDAGRQRVRPLTRHGRIR